MRYTTAKMATIAAITGTIGSKLLAMNQHQSQSSWLIDKLLLINQKLLPNNKFKKLYLQNGLCYTLPKFAKRLGFKQSEQNSAVIELNKFASSNRVLFFVHGGAYYLQPTRFHYQFIKNLAKRTHAKVVMPIYPKIPTNNALDVKEMIIEVYKEVFKKHRAKDITFIGDSAGGGIQLALLESLVKWKQPLPKQAILISPWLNIAIDSPLVRYLQPLDHLLDVEQLRRCGKKYANDLSIIDPWVSPMYGNLDDLPPISIFAGKHDILYADVRELSKRAGNYNLRLSKYIYPKMIHDFAILPIPEARQAMRTMTQIITQA